MEDINSFSKYNKLNLYKDGLKKFIDLQINQENKWNIVKKNLSSKLNNLDFIIGILFLTEMNRYCKNNGISVHGYYIAGGLIDLFSNIKNKLLFGKDISSESILFLFNNIANNIDYLNSRVDTSNVIRKKINENLSNLIMEITPLINEIIYFKKEHFNNQNIDLNDREVIFDLNIVNDENINLNNNIGLCNKNCYSCWVDEILTKFIYILLIIAKFMGTGNTKEPNLYKLAEYYSNIFYVILKLDSINNLNIFPDNYYQNLFVNYQDYKSKLIYSIMELDINSDTIDEIISYLDSIVINKFLEKKITIN
jgi:hypothetical protein